MWSRHIFHHYYYKVCSLHDFEFHFCQTIKMGKYSLLQNTSVAAWTDFHFLFKLTSCSLKFLGLWFGYASPMSKSFGANGSKSDISSLTKVKMKMNNGNILKVWRFVLYKGNQVKKFVHIYPLHRSGSNVLFKKVFISSFYQTFFQSV